MNTKVHKRLYSLEEAACYLGRSSWTVAEMTRAGVLPYIPDGKRKFLDVRDLDNWIKANKKREMMKVNYFNEQ